ncbi:hypothetical protein CIPAW_03G275600 [Carya illinoinensis]|uniref:Glycine-rich protein n=1 Tax=Carya illinoinensis TaxID=32201 RepID=A0A8T1R8M6_CARIL|nr:hypothetical protein CIPAW_03G275600 [Carya illinoinensis]
MTKFQPEKSGLFRCSLLLVELTKDIDGVNGIVDTDGSYGGGRGKYGGKRGGCYYGCCLRGYYGNRCRKCRSYAGEAMHVDSETDPSSQTRPGLN